MADTNRPQDQPRSRDPDSGIDRGHTQPGAAPDALPAVPPQTGEGYHQGQSTGDVAFGGMSAADLAGGGAGGDIDNPDITGKGSNEDLVKGEPADVGGTGGPGCRGSKLPHEPFKGKKT